jgi:hypothetical protein
MGSFKLKKPSPAMAVAIAALCVSLVGTAIAAPVALISLTKQEKKQVRKIAGKISNQSITARAPYLSVANANRADIANTAGTAKSADTAKSAETAKSADTAKSAESATNAANASNANTVGGVPASALTVGRSNQAECFGETGYTCASVKLPMPRAGRVLLVSQLLMHADENNSAATCHLTLNGVELPETTTTPGVLEDADSDQGSETANGGVTTVTGVVAAGTNTFAQVCSDTSGNPHFRNSSLSAVLLGTD